MTWFWSDFPFYSSVSCNDAADQPWNFRYANMTSWKMESKHLLIWVKTMCVEQGTIWTPRKNSQGLWRCHLRLLNSCTDTLGIKWSRARSICLSRYVREGRIAERPHVKADNGIRDCLNEILNENWLLTLTQLNKRLWQCLPQIPKICDRTVAEERRTNAVSYKTGQACCCARKKPSWCHS